jgi:hypothetical protein
MVERKVWEMGLKVEREHQQTYEWLQEYVKTYKRLPESTEFFLKIVQDHLKEDVNYYQKLLEAKL